jgi:predicted MFS family arabinose efflux permease
VTSQTTDPPRSDKSSGYGSLFRNQQFMKLWVAQVFSQFADRATFVLFVAVLTAKNMTSVAGHVVGAAQMTSILYVAFTIPAVVLSPVAGVYVDRWSNRSVLVFSNLARAVFVALIAVPWITNSLMATFALAFFLSIGSQFFGPAETSSIPRIVKKEELYAANSLFFTTMMIALGFGFAIGEPIIERSGPEGAPWVVAAGFLIAAFLVLSIEDNKRSHAPREAWWEELRFGIAYIANNPPVFRAIAKITILFSTIITLNIIAVGLAEQVMHIQPFQFGYIIAAAGLGMGIGNFWVGHYGREIKPTLLAYAGFVGLGLFMCMLGSLGYMQLFLFPQLGWHDVYFRGALMTIPLLFSVLIGISCACVAVPTQAALQAAVPEELRGKVFAAQNTAMSAASTIPVILTGVSADNLPGGVSTTLLIIGIPVFIAGLHHFNQTKREH